jgi:hypothetical protein
MARRIGRRTLILLTQAVERELAVNRRQLRIASPNHRWDRGSEAPNFIAAQNYALEVAAKFTWLSAIEVSFL